MAFSALNRISKVFAHPVRCFLINKYWIADVVTNEFRYIYGGSRYWDSTGLRIDPGKQISIQDQLIERCVSRDRTSSTRMLAVCHKVLRNQKLLCVSYSLIFVAISTFRRVLAREECFLGDSNQSRQLQFGATGADAKVSKCPHSKYPIWCQTYL